MLITKDYDEKKELLKTKIEQSSKQERTKYINDLLHLHLEAYETKLIDAETFGYVVTGAILDYLHGNLSNDTYGSHYDEIFEYSSTLELPPPVRQDHEDWLAKKIAQAIRQLPKNSDRV